MDNLLDYIKEVADGVNPDGYNQHVGGKAIQKFVSEEALPSLLVVSEDIMAYYFRAETSKSPRGHALLANLVKKIGDKFLENVEPEELERHAAQNVGALVIEAYYSEGLLEIFTVPMGEMLQYTVTLTHKGMVHFGVSKDREHERLQYVSLEPISPISGPVQRFQEISFPVKKGEFSDISIDTPHIRAIDNIQNTSWRVNRRVAKAVLDNPHLFTSDEPEDDEVREVRRLSAKVEYNAITKRMSQLMEENEFYYYVDVDYRGRMYYKEPFYNFQSSDKAKGTLLFANSKPMTLEGERWLAIHTAASFNQSYGIDEIPEWCKYDYKSHLEGEGLTDISVDKMTLDDRVRWTEQHMAEIIQAGESVTLIPKAEKIVSYLACCIEWADYKSAQKRRTVHYSRLPVPIDGSNNGWQHLAAMSCDEKTGDLVGLTPRDVPNDFYVQSAKKMLEIAEDERIVEILSKMPMKHIRKGISKRASMTRAYSAGARTIAKNMFDDCRGERFDELYGITQDDCTKLSVLIVKAIAEVCPGPLTTMKYFQDLVSYELGTFEKFDIEGNKADSFYTKLKKEWTQTKGKADKTPEELERFKMVQEIFYSYTNELVKGVGSRSIRWSTPSGFNVHYEKMGMDKDRCKIPIKGLKKDGSRSRINLVYRESNNTPDRQGYSSGISPNIVHSYDASHMALVIDSWKGDFGAVHDSFAVHACDVDDLVDITKAEFQGMYEGGRFLENIKTSILTEGGIGEEPETPNKGSLEIQELFNCAYFFS